MCVCSPLVSSLSYKAVDQRCPSLGGHSRLCGATLRRPFSCGWLPVWPWLSLVSDPDLTEQVLTSHGLSLLLWFYHVGVLAL